MWDPAGGLNIHLSPLDDKECWILLWSNPATASLSHDKSCIIWSQLGNLTTMTHKTVNGINTGVCIKSISHLKVHSPCPKSESEFLYKDIYGFMYMFNCEFTLLQLWGQVQEPNVMIV